MGWSGSWLGTHSVPFSTDDLFRFPAHFFRVLLLRRLWLSPLPVLSHLPVWPSTRRRFGQFFDQFWPIVVLADFGQFWCFNVLKCVGKCSQLFLFVCLLCVCVLCVVCCVLCCVCVWWCVRASLPDRTISLFCFPLPPQFSVLFSLFSVFFVEFWWCFRRPGPSNVHGFANVHI